MKNEITLKLMPGTELPERIDERLAYSRTVWVLRENGHSFEEAYYMRLQTFPDHWRITETDEQLDKSEVLYWVDKSKIDNCMDEIAVINLAVARSKESNNDK